MEIYCMDYDGQEIVNPSLTQWDTGQVLYITGLVYDTSVYDTPWFHFCNRNSMAVIRVKAQSDDDGETWYATVPDVLLQGLDNIIVYVYLPAVISGGKSKTAFQYVIPVIPRPRPDGIVMQEQDYEYLSVSQLKQELLAYIDAKLQ